MNIIFSLTSMFCAVVRMSMIELKRSKLSECQPKNNHTNQPNLRKGVHLTNHNQNYPS